MSFTFDNVHTPDQMEAVRAEMIAGAQKSGVNPDDIQFSVKGGVLSVDIPASTVNQAYEADVSGIANKVDDAQNLSKLAKAARLGSNVPVVGAAIGITATILTNKAHGAQIEYAEQLHDEGKLSPEALEAYKDLNKNTEKLLGADTAISTVDPTGLSVAVTAGAEVYTKSTFSDWADKHAPGLNQSDFETLSMSMFTGESAQSEMLLSAIENLPASIAGQPNIIHNAIELNNTLKSLVSELAEERKNHLTSGIDAGEGEYSYEEVEAGLSERISLVQNQLNQSINDMMSTPENANIILNIVPVEERLEYARTLFLQEGIDQDAIAEQHPQIAAYTNNYEESFTGWFVDGKDTLVDNQTLLNSFIIDAASGFSEKQLIEAPQQIAAFDSFVGDKTLLKEAALEDNNIQVSPDLLAQQPVQTTDQEYAMNNRLGMGG